MKQVLAVLLAGAVAACGPSDYLPPMDFSIDGVKKTLLAEWNVPQETAVKQGVETIVYTAEGWDQLQTICGADHGNQAAACTYLLAGTMCLVWLLPSASIPDDVLERTRRHELFGHCNGHQHDLVNGETVWRKG